MAERQPEWKSWIRRRAATPLLEPVATNVDIVGFSAMGGRLDGQQLQFQTVGEHHHLYVGHPWSGGISILDVTSPKDPQVAAFIPTPNEHTWHIKVQVADDILMASCEVAFFKPGVDASQAWPGVRFFDVSDPTQPRELSHWSGSEPKDYGVHRSWWNGGRYAYLSNMIDAPGVSYHWRSGRTRVMTILDVADPENPKRVSDFWHPVQLGEGPEALPDETFGVHFPLVEGDRAYVAYSDGGFGIVDVSDPEHATLISHVRTFPDLTDGQTHTCVPLLDRGILVVCEEPMVNYGLEGPKNIRLWDISDETMPTEISTLPIPDPTDREPYPSYYHKGERFGPHNMNENHRGTKQIDDKVYNAYFNAGLRVFDISDPARPVETASFVPPTPTEWVDPRPFMRIFDVIHGGVRDVCSQDVLVDPRGYVYLSGLNDGIWILEEKGSGPADNGSSNDG
jgi:hypothetical protein